MSELLNIYEHGDDTLPPLVIAHGLFGSGRNWGVISKRLSDIRHVIAVDMRNHGDSFHADASGYEDMAGDLAVVIGSLGGRADLLGHSMGGKAAMVLALREPELVDRLIVADIAPVTYEHSQMHVLDAMRAVDLTGVKFRSQVDPKLAEFLDEPSLRAFLLQSLAMDAAGARWKLNLDALGVEMSRILGFPKVSGRFDGPTHFVTGANSDYVKNDYKPRILELFPNAGFNVVEGAGHWLHAEAPRAFEASLRAVLI